MHERIRNLRRSGIVVATLGILGLLTTVPVAVEFVLAPRVDIGVGILVGVVSGGGVLYGAYRVRQSFPPYAIERVTDRTVLGTVLMGLLVSPVLLAGEPDRPFELVRTLASVGMFTGLLVGYSEAQTAVIRRQADNLEDERERFEFLNSLLRHDVNNKLVVLLGSVEFQLESGVDSEEVRETLETVHRTATEIEHLLGDMEALTDADSAAERGTVGVESLLGPELQAVEEDPDATLETDIDGEATVAGGEPLASAFRNLLQNAVEHNDAPTVSVTVEEVGDEVRFRIADDGRGIPADRREALFDPESPGFGLYIVEELVERYDGHLGVSDNDPSGTVFTIRLPSQDWTPDPDGGEGAEATALAD